MTKRKHIIEVGISRCARCSMCDAVFTGPKKRTSLQIKLHLKKVHGKKMKNQPTIPIFKSDISYSKNVSKMTPETTDKLVRFLESPTYI